MIYQILSKQSDVKDQKVFQYKKVMLKDSNNTIEIRFIGKNQYSSPEEKKCYKLEHLMITTFNSEQHLWLKSPISHLMLPNHFQVSKMRYCYLYCYKKEKFWTDLAEFSNLELNWKNKSL